MGVKQPTGAKQVEKSFDIITHYTTASCYFLIFDSIYIRNLGKQFVNIKLCKYLH